MASKAVAVVPQKQQQQQQQLPQPKGQLQPKGVFGKHKVAGEGRNRQVLKDIGNLVQGKLQSPSAAPEKTKKPVIQLVNEKSKSDKVVAVVVENDNITVVSGQGVASRKNARAFTSTLSVRSKAASGLTSKLKDLKLDIDTDHADNELAVVEYLDDIYQFYKLSQDENRVHEYMALQPEINGKMRSILVDWLIEVHHKFELTAETLYLTINIVDRFLSVELVPRRELQLLGISSMLLASKYEEIWAPEVNDFVCISDNAYGKEKVLVLEKKILGKLGWCLTVPTPYVFLVRYIKASGPSDEDMGNMVFFLAELSLTDYTCMILYCPSMIAASAVYAARFTLDKSPLWTETLKHYTGYSEDELRDCAKVLVTLHLAAAESKLKAVYKKFCSPKLGAVALLSPAAKPL